MTDQVSGEVAGGLDEPEELQPEPGALRLAAPEDTGTRADWEKAAADVLRKSRRLSDDDPDSAVGAALTTTTYDGIDVPPLGTPDQGTVPVTPRPTRAGACFFFQAEDGIRDKLVTGVQTCALPISIMNFSLVSRVWRAASYRCVVRSTSSSQLADGWMLTSMTPGSGVIRKLLRRGSLGGS